MRISEFIDASQYQHILINALDRLVDFYVIQHAAKKMNGDVVAELVKFRTNTESFFIQAGFAKEDLVNLNAIDESIDIFQVNYSYCRTMHNKTENVDIRIATVYKEVTKYIYEINTGNYVEVTNDAVIIHTGTPKEQSSTKSMMKLLRKRNPCLHLLRIVDIVNAPTLEGLIPHIDNAMASYRKLNNVDKGNLKTGDKIIIETAIENIIKLVSFYPERLYPGLHYVFPQYDGPQDHNSLALSFSHSTSNTDMQSALNDIAFQFEKFKTYYHKHETNFIDDIRLERLKPLISKPTRDNEYIKQLNSVEGTFHALFAWQKHYLDKLPHAEAINHAHVLFNEKKDLPMPVDAYKRRVRNRLMDINKYVEAKEIYMNTLS